MVKEQGGWSQQERMNKGWPLQTNVINATALIQTYSSSSDGLSVEGAVVYRRRNDPLAGGPNGVRSSW